MAVEVKRRITLDAVHQLLRYMEVLNMDGSIAPVRGILVGLTAAPQAEWYATSKGIKVVLVDYDELRGLRADDLTLF